MKLRFYLHNKASAEGVHPIYMEVRWGNHAAAAPGTWPALRMSTGKGCRRAHWNEDKEKVTTKDPASTGANDRLAALESTAARLLDKAAANETHVTVDELRAALLAVLNKKPRPSAPAAEPAPPRAATIGAVAAEYVAYHLARRGAFALRKYKSFVDCWQAYRPDTLLAELLPADGTHRTDIVEGWLAYLATEHALPSGEVGLRDNTIGSHVSRLKQLLQFSGLRADWLENVFSYEPDIEPLLFEEVLQLATQWLPEGRLANVRDCFVFNCLTGMRYANLQTLTPDAVSQDPSGTWVVEYAPVKASRKSKRVRVALDPLALTIWQRHGGRLPVPTNQKMNTYIKEAARMAGLDRSVLKVNRKGGQLEEVRGPLWQFITCHVARHTFGTLLLDGGADLAAAQDGLGHASIQNTRRYAKTREGARHVTTLAAFGRLRGEAPAPEPEETHTTPQSVRTRPESTKSLRAARRTEPHRTRS